jgi:hypothetical protein
MTTAATTTSVKAETNTVELGLDQYNCISISNINRAKKFSPKTAEQFWLSLLVQMEKECN